MVLPVGFKLKESTFVMVSSLLLQGFSALQYLLMQSFLDKEGIFSWQFFIILGISIAVSLYSGLNQRVIPVFLTIRLFLIFLMGYPLGTHLWLELTLLLSLLLETGLYLTPPWNLPLMLFFDLSLLFFQRPVSAFYKNMPGPDMQDLLFFLVLSLVTTFLIFSVSRQRKRGEEAREIIDRLDETISRLGKANLGFQNITSSLELDTLKKERNRVSREIHDTVGYSLTNIRIMLEAATFMVENDTAETRDLIQKSMEEAGTCLEETRNAMRQLRSRELSRIQGMKSFFHLIKVFGEATGIRVRIEFGNLPDSLGHRIDKTIFRFIQEGLTNSFRHGRASEIGIYFWIQNRILKVSLQDNGSGAEDLSEGIGLAGMKERLTELGGKMFYKNVSDGFEIAIEIPLNREDI